MTGDVTFTAIPQNGYTLKSWKITDAENNTDIVNAAGSNTYTLTLGSTKYTVEAEFERVSETDRPVKLTYSVASGNETGMAATKQTYQSGSAVPVGTKINFIAQAAEGYRVQKLVITKNGIPDTVITDNRLYDMYSMSSPLIPKPISRYTLRRSKNIRSQLICRIRTPKLPLKTGHRILKAVKGQFRR